MKLCQPTDSGLLQDRFRKNKIPRSPRGTLLRYAVGKLEWTCLENSRSLIESPEEENSFGFDPFRLFCYDAGNSSNFALRVFLNRPFFSLRSFRSMVLVVVP